MFVNQLVLLVTAADVTEPTTNPTEIFFGCLFASMVTISLVLCFWMLVGTEQYSVTRSGVTPNSNQWIGTSVKRSNQPAGPLVGYKVVKFHNNTNYTYDDIHKAYETLKIGYHSASYGVSTSYITTSKCHRTSAPYVNKPHNFHIKCTCGFYAYKDYDETVDYTDYAKGMPIAEVTLSGEYVEYTKGYRAEHQRITSIIFDDCAYCDEPAVIVSSTNFHSTMVPSIEGLCKNHLEEWVEEKTNSNPPTISDFRMLVLQNRLSSSTRNFHKYKDLSLYSFEEFEKALPQPVQGYKPTTVVSHYETVTPLTTAEVEAYRQQLNQKSIAPLVLKKTPDRHNKYSTKQSPRAQTVNPTTDTNEEEITHYITELDRLNKEQNQLTQTARNLTNQVTHLQDELKQTQQKLIENQKNLQNLNNKYDDDHKKYQEEKQRIFDEIMEDLNSLTGNTDTVSDDDDTPEEE